MLKEGIKGASEVCVTRDNTAAAMGSGELEVFATPAMIALIEKTAWQSVAPHLEEGEGTVGIRLDVDHLAPTPVGVTVRCTTELTEVDGRRLVFTAEVYDECGLVGKGTHQRFIVKNGKFQQKADARRGGV